MEGQSCKNSLTIDALLYKVSFGIQFSSKIAGLKPGEKTTDFGLTLAPVCWNSQDNSFANTPGKRIARLQVELIS